MPQTSKVSRNNTTIERHPDGSLKRVTLHGTLIFEQGPAREDGSRVLAISNGGYNTVTTQTRLNQCFSEAGLPLRCQRAGGTMAIRSYNPADIRQPEKHWYLPASGGCLLLLVYPNGSVMLADDKFVVVN